MMQIRKMETGREFKVTVKEHNAEIICSPEELKLVNKRNFAYACPICGRVHIVPAYRVEEQTVYATNVPLDHPELPINVEKKQRETEQNVILTLIEKIDALEKAINKKDEDVPVEESKGNEERKPEDENVKSDNI